MDIPWIWPKIGRVHLASTQSSLPVGIFRAAPGFARSLTHSSTKHVWVWIKIQYPQNTVAWNGLSNKSTYIHKLCCCSQVWILNHSKPTASHQKKRPHEWFVLAVPGCVSNSKLLPSRNATRGCQRDCPGVFGGSQPLPVGCHCCHCISKRSNSKCIASKYWGSALLMMIHDNSLKEYSFVFIKKNMMNHWNLGFLSLRRAA